MKRARSTADPAAVAAEYAVLWAQLSLRKESTRTVESTVPGGEPCTLPCTLPSFFCYYPELRRRVVQARDGEIVGGVATAAAVRRARTAGFRLRLLFVRHGGGVRLSSPRPVHVLDLKRAGIFKSVYEPKASDE